MKESARNATHRGIWTVSSKKGRTRRFLRMVISLMKRALECTNRDYLKLREMGSTFTKLSGILFCNEWRYVGFDCTIAKKSRSAKRTFGVSVVDAPGTEPHDNDRKHQKQYCAVGILE